MDICSWCGKAYSREDEEYDEATGTFFCSAECKAAFLREKLKEEMDNARFDREFDRPGQRPFIPTAKEVRENEETDS